MILPLVISITDPGLPLIFIGEGIKRLSN